MIPEKFDEKQYIIWHEKTFENDKGFEKKLEKLLSQLSKDAKEDLIFMSNIFKIVISKIEKKYERIHGSNFEYEFPLLKILASKNEKKYNLLFKSKKSVINKLWRKNRGEKKIELKNIKENINDLVRTEIVTSNLETCKFLATSLEMDYISSIDKKLAKFEQKISEIKFEPEMKMESGYFAYHGLVRFRSGIRIEIQLYSTLMKSWRKLSHKLYEESRIQADAKVFDYGTKETRLISLGHLLHLAECEMLRLEEEIRNRYRH